MLDNDPIYGIEVLLRRICNPQSKFDHGAFPLRVVHHLPLMAAIIGLTRTWTEFA
jgi:hypothetical protein